MSSQKLKSRKLEIIIIVGRWVRKVMNRKTLGDAISHLLANRTQRWRSRCYLPISLGYSERTWSRTSRSDGSLDASRERHGRDPQWTNRQCAPIVGKRDREREREEQGPTQKKKREEVRKEVRSRWCKKKIYIWLYFQSKYTMCI